MGDASSSAATHPTEDRRLKIAGLALVGAALPGLAWLALRFDAAGAWQRDALLLAGDALVLIVCANLATIGLLVLLSGFGRRDWWRDARARRAALVKLAGANVLLPVLVFSMLQDDQTVSALLEEDWIAGPFALAAWVLIALGASTLRRAWRHEAATADEAMRADPRAPVVYLRSFQDDGQMLLEGGQRWWRKRVLSRFGATSTEQELAFILERIGPVIAIGKPGEPLPELGAARLYVAHEHWQQTVIGMLRRAAVVAIRIGASAGVRWEIERTLESVPRARILFIVLGDDEGAAQAARQLSELLGVGIAMPTRPSGLQRWWSSLLWSDPRRRLGTLICFARDGTPIVEPVRAWPKHAADLVVMLLAMRPTAGPLRDAFRRVYAHWGRAWHEHKSRGVAIGLALLLGGFGAHWFYLGRHRIGFVYLLFVVVAVPIVLAWIDALRWILMDRARFDERVLLPAASTGQPQT
jgi:TM2 domain-containing membrane protein YozV